MEDFKISDYLEEFNKVSKRGKCKGCSAYISWNRERVASHKRTSCTAICDEERIFFSKTKIQEVLFDGSSNDSFSTQQVTFEVLENHSEKCRLCLKTVKNDQEKISLSEEVFSMISELQIQVCLHYVLMIIFMKFWFQCTDAEFYSSFICPRCHQNLLHFSTFRREISSKQKQLTDFLCRVKQETDFSDFQFAVCETVKSEPNMDPKTDPVVIKTEKITEEKAVRITEWVTKTINISAKIKNNLIWLQGIPNISIQWLVA